MPDCGESPTLAGMKRLADLVTDTRYAWAIVVIVALVTAVCFGLAGQLKQEDDVLSFLPESGG